MSKKQIDQIKVKVSGLTITEIEVGITRQIKIEPKRKGDLY